MCTSSTQHTLGSLLSAYVKYAPYCAVQQVYIPVRGLVISMERTEILQLYTVL